MKALKRQVDEAEEEIERLDGLRKKAQRELEEQHEVNEQLQARIKTLEKDSWYGLLFCPPAQSGWLCKKGMSSPALNREEDL